MATVRQYLKSEAAVSTNPLPPPSPSLVLNPDDYYTPNPSSSGYVPAIMNHDVLNGGALIATDDFSVSGRLSDSGCTVTGLYYPVPINIKITDKGAGGNTVNVYYKLVEVGPPPPAPNAYLSSLAPYPWTLLGTVTPPTCSNYVTLGPISNPYNNTLVAVLITNLNNQPLSCYLSFIVPTECQNSQWYSSNDHCVTSSNSFSILTDCLPSLPFPAHYIFNSEPYYWSTDWMIALKSPLTTLPCVSPPVLSPTPTPTPSPSPVPTYYNANEYSCNILGTCGKYLGIKSVYNESNNLTLTSFYTGSANKVYQILSQLPADVSPTAAIRVDSRPYNSCNQACSIPSCYSGSIVNYSGSGWIKYNTCSGSLTHVELSGTGSYVINPCHICSSITGSTGPGASGSMSTILSVTCGYDCYIPLSPSATPTPTLTPTKTPSLTPSKTPSTTPTPTPSVSPSIAVSPSPSSPPPVSPACTCPAGYIGSYDGTTCISSSTAFPNSYIVAPGDRIDWGGTSFVWGKNGVRIYNGYDSSGNATNNYTYQTPQSNLNVWDSIWPTLPNTSITPDIFWANRLNTNGIWVDNNPYWPGPPGGDPPYPNYREICSVLYVPTAGTYYVGLGGDNRPVLKIDGTTIVDKGCCSLENFNYWHIYPINLSAGPHLIEVRNWNYTGSVGVAPNNYSIGVFACEIYNNTLPQLLNATSDTNINPIFSTGEYCKARQTKYPALQASQYPGNVGGYSTTAFNGPSYPNGPKVGFTFCNNSYCPPGFMLDASDPYNPICRKFDYITAPCNPDPTPSISVSPSKTPSVSATPSVTPSVSSTPCPTVSITPTPTITPTLSPSPPSCNCENGIIINNNLYFYYDCTGSYQSGSNALNTPVCFNTALNYSKNVVTNGTSCCTAPPSVSPTPSVTPSVTPTVSVTPTKTPSVTPSVTISITPTVSKTPSVTPTPSPSEFCIGNLITNGQFTSNLNGWDSGSTENGNWRWVIYNGSGQALYTGTGSATLSQDVLSVGNYYNISFDTLSDLGEYTSSLYVYLGTNVFGPIVASGTTTNINFSATCLDNTTFAITAVADDDKAQQYFIDNICVIDVS